MGSCILCQNADQTITVLDVPSSIEQVQGFQNEQYKRLISSEAIDQPFASTEPKSAKAVNNLEAASIKSLLLERAMELAIQEVHAVLKGPWCHPRVTQDRVAIYPHTLKRQGAGLARDDSLYDSKRAPSTGTKRVIHQDVHLDRNYTKDDLMSDTFHHNGGLIVEKLELSTESKFTYIPPGSTYLQGDIESTLTIFNLKAPLFNLVLLDPPWPNRSARRKKSYQISETSSDITVLLSSIQISEHLAEDALVGIWVTNKLAIHDMVLGPNGLFDTWGLQLVEEWVWLKTTTSGQPICALDSTWRKPYETLIIGKKIGAGFMDGDCKRRIIIGVPDLHSRKPNLKFLFEPMLPSKYEALEVFARNLTEGWWAWGNEVLKFQSEEHWLDRANDT